MTNPLPSQKTGAKPSPMMLQWQECKTSSGSALLLFRMGDFYEAFHEDANELASALNVTLTRRQGIPMAGVPAISLNSTLNKLANRGYRVAIAEQIGDPKKSKGLVKREVVKTITPGTYIDEDTPSKTNHFIVSVYESKNLWGLSSCDLSTGEFYVSEMCENDLLTELFKLKPKELLIPSKGSKRYEGITGELSVSSDLHIQRVEAWKFDFNEAHESLCEHFKVQSMDGFGLKGWQVGICAAGALMDYLKVELKQATGQIQTLSTYSDENYMQIDRISQKNLELVDPIYRGQDQTTLLNCIDKTLTPMGGRLLHKWLLRPLKSKAPIVERHVAIEEAISQELNLSALRKALTEARDLQRLCARVATLTLSPRDMVLLKQTCALLPLFNELLNEFKSPLWKKLQAKLSPMDELVALLERALVDEPPTKLGEGRTFKEGYHEKLDEIRTFSKKSKEWLLTYQDQLKESFGIKNLKVGFTPAFGYYIEVSKGQSHLMPDTFQRRQTLVNAERFISSELKEFEDKVLHASEEILKIEQHLLEEIRNTLAPLCVELTERSEALAVMDCLLSLAEKARMSGYTRPKILEGDALSIAGGRHPVVEEVIEKEDFVSNDTYLGVDQTRMMLLTGPNMAGKSTYIRQVALLVILAQMGSFVPASEMQLGLVDKIFTRVGASDDLARGQSTFMVEMSEAANILNNATDQSLVILDEVGRGTSTYDGISLAQSIAEYLLTQEGVNPKTLFATHYWELTSLSDQFKQVENYHIAIKEWKDQIVFLHKIVKGSTDKSYGIHVAKLAGLPEPVITRALEIQKELESSAEKSEAQLSLFDTSFPSLSTQAEEEAYSVDPVVETMGQLDLNQITPLDALFKLKELQDQIKTRS